MSWKRGKQRQWGEAGHLGGHLKINALGTKVRAWHGSSRLSSNTREEEASRLEKQTSLGYKAGPSLKTSNGRGCQGAGT